MRVRVEVVRVCVEAEGVGLGCEDGECIEVARMGIRSIGTTSPPRCPRMVRVLVERLVRAALHEVVLAE